MCLTGRPLYEQLSSDLSFNASEADNTISVQGGVCRRRAFPASKMLRMGWIWCTSSISETKRDALGSICRF